VVSTVLVLPLADEHCQRETQGNRYIFQGALTIVKRNQQSIVDGMVRLLEFVHEDDCSLAMIASEKVIQP